MHSSTAKCGEALRQSLRGALLEALRQAPRGSIRGALEVLGAPRKSLRKHYDDHYLQHCRSTTGSTTEPLRSYKDCRGEHYGEQGDLYGEHYGQHRDHYGDLPCPTGTTTRGHQNHLKAGGLPDLSWWNRSKHQPRVVCSHVVLCSTPDL